jgi:hypothetical protein
LKKHFSSVRKTELSFKVENVSGLYRFRWRLSNWRSSASVKKHGWISNDCIIWDVFHSKNPWPKRRLIGKIRFSMVIIIASFCEIELLRLVQVFFYIRDSRFLEQTQTPQARGTPRQGHKQRNQNSCLPAKKQGQDGRRRRRTLLPHPFQSFPLNSSPIVVV